MTDPKRAKKYEKNKLILSVSETILMIILFIWFILSGYSVHLSEWVAGISSHHYLRFFIFTGILAAVLSMMSLVFGFISGYLMEHRYNLSNQTLKDWIIETLKGLAVGVALSIPILFFCIFF